MKWTHSFEIGNTRPRFLLAMTVVMMLVLSLSAAAQNNYYVSPSGSDSNNGTSPGTAWKTVNKAISSFALGSGGAVIHVADGTYGNVSVSRGGSSPTVRLVIQCDNGIASSLAAQGHCKFNGSGTAWSLNNGSNFDIRGFDIGGNGNQFDAIVGIPCGSMGHSTCLDSVHIIGNYIHDLAQNISLDSSGCSPFGQAPGAVLLLNHHGWYVNDTQVIGNTIFRYGPPSNPNCNTGPNGLYIDTQGAIIQNNLIVQVYNFGIQYYGQPCNAVISNNTIITNNAAMTVSGGGEGICTPGNMTISNNIMFNSKIAKIHQISSFPCSDSGHQSLFAHNISDGAGADFNNAPATSCNTITPSTFAHVSPNGIFVNYKTDGSGDYHLAPGSMAIAAGTNQCVAGGKAPCVPRLDLAAANRPNLPSLGVFEADSGMASAPPAPSGLTAIVQ